MKIGIDLDGVVIDSEKLFRIYEEIFAIEELKNNKIIDRSEPKFQGRYNWSKEEQNKFINKYFMEVARTNTIMTGFLPVYKRLKEEGHEFVVITARGGFIQKMKDEAIRILNENNIEFDKYYYKQDDKLDVCIKENIDIMIDDDYKVIERLSNNGIKTLYFRDTNLKKLEENDNVYEVNNWGDIYRYFYERREK